MPSSTRLFNRFRAAGTNGCLDLIVSLRKHFEDPLKRSYKIYDQGPDLRYTPDSHKIWPRSGKNLAKSGVIWARYYQNNYRSFSDLEKLGILVSGSKSETLVSDKLQSHSNHVLIWKKPTDKNF